MIEVIMSEIRNLTRNGETFYPLTTSSAVINEATGEGIIIDEFPTPNSKNIVESGGVYEGIENLAEKIPTLTRYSLLVPEVLANKYYDINGEHTNQYFRSIKYSVEEEKIYSFSGYFGTTVNTPFIAWADSNNNIIKEEFKGSMGVVDEYYDQPVISPKGAVYSYLNQVTGYYWFDTSIFRQINESGTFVLDGYKYSCSINESSIKTPTSIVQNKIINYVNGEVTFTNWGYKKYSIQGGNVYSVNSRGASDSGIYYINYLDANGNYLSREKYNSSNSTGSKIENILIVAPDNAAFLIVNFEYRYCTSDEIVSVKEFSRTSEINKHSDSLENIITRLSNKKFLVPISTEIGYKINNMGVKFSTNGFALRTYEVTGGKTYLFGGTKAADTYGFYYIYWFDSSDNPICGSLYMENGDTSIIYSKPVIAPSNAVKAKISYYNYIGYTVYFEFREVEDIGTETMNMSLNALPSCDLNDVRSSGTWILNDSNTYTNKPTDDIGFLRASCTGRWTLQEYFCFTDNKYYKRKFRNDVSSPENWAQVGGITPITNNYEFNEYQQTVNLTATPSITTDTNNYLASTRNTTDRTADILSMLQSTGVCNLGPGVFYIDSLVMPENTKLTGQGFATSVIVKDGADKFGIRCSSYCTISNFKLLGSETNITLTSTIGNRHGILWQGDFSQGQVYTDQPERGIVQNMWIARFNGGGITLYDTGYGVINNLSVDNCYLWNNTVGINVSYWSEFNQFSNIKSNYNYYGCINNGGNNVFTNCDFSISSYVAFLMDNSQNQSPNNSHGSCVGCVFNHTSEGGQTNSGTGIKVLNCTSGFMFTGCQIFFSKIYLKDSLGMTFANCNFGQVNCDITVDGGGSTLFMGNMHAGTPPSITITNNDKTHFVNCYNRTTGALITP